MVVVSPSCWNPASAARPVAAPAAARFPSLDGKSRRQEARDKQQSEFIDIEYDHHYALASAIRLYWRSLSISTHCNCGKELLAIHANEFSARFTHAASTMSAEQSPVEERLEDEGGANGLNGDVDDDDDDVQTSRRRAPVAAVDEDEDGGDDLFGDDEDGDAGEAEKTYVGDSVCVRVRRQD